MNNEFNLGGYDKYAFNDTNGVAHLTLLLQRNMKMAVHFSAGDKTPNIDGWVDLCSDGVTKQVPDGKIEVQIKTLDKDYTNISGGYKYSCDTKIFNYVKKGITINPVFLFLIDVRTYRVFGINISHQYVLGLGEYKDKKIIYFTDDDEIADPDIFFEKAMDIYKEYLQIMHDPQKSLVQVDSQLDEIILKELQGASDCLNQLFDTDLHFIKDYFFKDVWKLGIGFKQSNNPKFSVLGIYQIKKGQDGLLVKSFEFENGLEAIKSHQYKTIMSFLYTGLESILERINDFISSNVEEYFKDDRNSFIHPKRYLKPQYLADLVLSEYTYFFLDKFAVYIKEFEKSGFPGVFYADEISLDDLKKLWNTIEALTYEGINKQVFLPEKPLVVYIHDPFDYTKYYTQRFIEILHNEDRFEVESTYEIVKQSEYLFFEEIVKEFEKRNIKSIKRVWKHKDLLHPFEGWVGNKGMHRRETVFRFEDYFDNVNKLYAELPNCYKQTLERLFGRLSSYYEIKNEYHLYISKSPSLSYIYSMSKSNSFSIKYHNEDICAGTNSYADVFDILNKIYPNNQHGAGGLSLFQDETPLYTYIRQLIYQSIRTKLNLKKHGHYSGYPLIN